MEVHGGVSALMATPVAPSPGSSRPAHSWESGGCSCSIQALAHRPNRILAAIPVIPLIIVAIATAGGTLATTGRLMRWLPETGPGRALAATLAIAMLCMVIDITMITLIMVSGAPSRPLLIIAFAASLTRIVCSITTVRHANLMRV